MNEIFSNFVISQSLPKMMHIILNDIHPPLYYFLLKLWSQVFGMSAYSLEGFSVLTSVALSLLFYYLVSIISRNRWISLFSFILIQFSPFLFDYSVLIRMYLLATLFVITAFIFFWRIFQATTIRNRDIFLFSLSSAAAYYTHYLSSVAIAVFVLCFFLRILKKEISFKPILTSIILILILTAPWYPIMVKQQLQHRRNYDIVKEAQENPKMVNFGYKVFQEKPTGGYYIDKRNLPYFVLIKKLVIEIFSIRARTNTLSILFFIYLVYFIILIFFARSLWHRNFAGFLIIMVTTSYFAVNFILGISGGRYFIFLAPFFMLLIALAIEEMFKTTTKAYLCILFSSCIIALYVSGILQKLYGKYCKPTTQVVKLIEKNYVFGDVVVFHNFCFEIPFEYYSSQSGFFPLRKGFPINVRDWWQQQPYQGWGGVVASKDDLAQFIKNLKDNDSVKTIWLVFRLMELFDPGDTLLVEIQKSFKNVTGYDINYGECSKEEKHVLSEKYRVYRVEKM